MGRRRKAREVALQVLFEIDVLGLDPQEAIDLYWSNFEAPKEARGFSTRLIEGVCGRREEIDQLITSCSDNWAIARMSRVDRNILRLAVYELFHCHDVPPKVTLNEAIDLGKEFGSENSGSFINGILDTLNARLQKENDHTDQNGNA
jgi:transcription antitermination protein NusB